MNSISKQRVLTILLAALCLTIAPSLYAKVPVEVKQALLAKYPNAQRISWKHYLKDEYQATFMLDEDEAHIFIGHKGEFIESYVQLHEEHIPQQLFQELKEIEDESEIHYVLMTTNASDITYYKTKVKIDDEIYEFSFDINYVLLSKMLIE